MPHNSSKNTIVFLSSKDYFNILGPFINSTLLWAKKGFNVEVISYTESEKIKNKNDKINYLSLTKPYIVKWLCKIIDALFSFVHSSKRQGYKYFISNIYFSYKTHKYLKKNKNKIFLVVATEPFSLLSAHLIKKYCPYIYFEQELTLWDESFGLLNRLSKYFEVISCKGAICCTEFDEYRSKLFSKDNHYPPNKMIILPNAPLGKPKLERKYYFNEKFNIDKKKKILLYTGGIALYNYTYEIIEKYQETVDDVVLVMHCWGSRTEIEKLVEYASGFAKKVYFSLESLEYEDIDMLYSSCDIGFAMYSDNTLNHKFTGFSSGKMFNFFKACVPVITNNTLLLSGTIGSSGLGVCINNVNELNYAINKILVNEVEMKNNCFLNYYKFCFEDNHEKLINIVLQHSHV